MIKGNSEGSLVTLVLSESEVRLAMDALGQQAHTLANRDRNRKHLKAKESDSLCHKLRQIVDGGFAA